MSSMVSDPNASASPMESLRRELLTSTPEAMGFSPNADFPEVYGIVMDMPAADTHVASVIALCDGHASLYSTSSFGVLGGSHYVQVREAAQEFVRQAGEWHSEGTLLRNPSLPAENCVRFCVLTFHGVRVIDCRLDEITEEGHRLRPLFSLGQMLLSYLLQIADREQQAQTSRAADPVPAYVNCLLTLMAEGILESAELIASREVPDLVRLASGHPATQKWILDQQFSPTSVDTRKVIRELIKVCKISGIPILSRSKPFPVVHAQEDGTRITRVFDVTIGPLNRSARITILGTT